MSETLNLRKACDACHASKVKCTSAGPDLTNPISAVERERLNAAEHSSAHSSLPSYWTKAPCERCARSRMDCIVSPPDPRPKKRQRISGPGKSTNTSQASPLEGQLQPPTPAQALSGSSLRGEPTEPQNRRQQQEFAQWYSAPSLEDFLTSIDSPFQDATFPAVDTQMLEYELGVHFHGPNGTEGKTPDGVSSVQAPMLASTTLDTFNAQLEAQLESAVGTPAAETNDPAPDALNLNSRIEPPPPIEGQVDQIGPEQLLPIISKALASAVEACRSKSTPNSNGSAGQAGMPDAARTDHHASLLPLAVRSIQILAQIVKPYCERLGVLPGGDAFRANPSASARAHLAELQKRVADLGGVKAAAALGNGFSAKDNEARTTFMLLFSVVMQIVNALHAIVCTSDKTASEGGVADGSSSRNDSKDMGVLSALHFRQAGLPAALQQDLAEEGESRKMELRLPPKVSRILKIGLVSAQCEALIHVLQDVRALARVSHDANAQGSGGGEGEDGGDGYNLDSVIAVLQEGSGGKAGEPAKSREATLSETVQQDTSDAEGSRRPSTGHDSSNTTTENPSKGNGAHPHQHDHPPHECVIDILARKCQEGTEKLKKTLDGFLPE